MKMKRKLLLLLAGLAVLGCGTALAAEADGHPDNYYKSDKVTVQNVDFNNQYKMKVAGHLFTPKVKNANNGAAVIVGHPMGAVKEQSADLYANKLAEQGFTTLSIDLSFWGGSEAHSREFSEKAYARAAEPKELYIVPGAGHVDLYDKTDLIPFGKLTDFFAGALK